MRTLFLLFVIVFAGGYYVYSTNPELRDKVRGIQVSDDDRAKFDAYLQGKSLLRSALPSGTTVKFEAWGDDANETAQALPVGDLWLAKGHADVSTGGGAPQHESWCIAFDPKSGKVNGEAFGKKADDTISYVDSGKLNQKSAPTVGSVFATPAPGSWMWSKEHRGALDQPAKPTTSR